MPTKFVNFVSARENAQTTCPTQINKHTHTLAAIYTYIAAQVKNVMKLKVPITN